MESGPHAGILLLMDIQRAWTKDAQELLNLQRIAFQSEAEVYQHCTIPPLTQTLEELTDEILKKVFFKAVKDGKIIGSVRGYRSSGTCYLERLMVLPEHQGQGIGTKLMGTIEEHFRGRVDRYQLSTGHKSESNIRLYKKLGYTIYKTEKINSKVSFVYMEKLP